MTDYRTAPIDSEFKQLLCFTEKVARDAGQITAADIAGLRAAGFSDRAVLDTAHVAGFFSYMNRVVQALGADSKAPIAPKPIAPLRSVPTATARPAIASMPQPKSIGPRGCSCLSSSSKTCAPSMCQQARLPAARWTCRSRLLVQQRVGCRADQDTVSWRAEARMARLAPRTDPQLLCGCLLQPARSG